MLNELTGKALNFNFKKNLCLEHCLLGIQRRPYLCFLNGAMIICNTPGRLVGLDNILMSRTNYYFPYYPYLAYT